MYGLVFLAVKDLVLSKFSEKQWAAIIASAKCTADFATDRSYDDSTLYDIVAAASKVLGMATEEVVEHAGYWFMVYIRNKTTYGHLLEFMGDNLPDFLSNINRLHTHLLKGAHFPEINSPRFRVSRRKKDSLVLHYSPGRASRIGLAPLVMGIVKGIAMEILKLDRISVQQIKTRERDGADVFQVNWSPACIAEDEHEGRTPSRGESPRAVVAPPSSSSSSSSSSKASPRSDHSSGDETTPAIFSQCPFSAAAASASASAATAGAAGESSKASSKASSSSSSSSHSSHALRGVRPQSIGLPPKGLSRLFPFHLMFDRDCVIQQAGPAMQRIVPMEVGDHMSHYFTITEPPACSFDSFRPIYLNRKVAPFTIVHGYDDDSQLTLHGEMVWCKAKQVMCFACTPALASIEEAKYFGIDIADFSLCDQAQARLLSSHAQLMKGTQEDPGKEKKEPERRQNIFKLLRTAAPTSPRKKAEKLKKAESFNEKHDDKSRPPSRPDPDVVSPGRGGGSRGGGAGVPRLAISGSEKRRRSSSTPSPPLVTPPPSSSSSSSARNGQQADEHEAEEALSVPSMNFNRMLNAFTEMLLEDSWDQYALVRAVLQMGMSEEDGSEVRAGQLFDAVMSFYSRMGKVQNLLLVVLFDELASLSPADQGQGAVLFREDSVGLRMLTTFFNQEGRSYLQLLTAPLLQAVASLDSPLELDPARNPSGADREQSAKRVLELAQDFLVHVCGSAHSCPLSVRRVLAQVSGEVRRHWPEMYVQAVANLFFLRFLSPALVAAGLGAGGVGAGQHRTLMLVSKCVYSLMNQVPFGEKEPYMAPMNAFLSSRNLGLVQTFMRELVDEEAMARAPVSLTPRAKSASGRLYGIVTSVDIIKKALLSALPALWKLALDRPPLQKKLQGLLSVALCDIPSEAY